MMHSLSPRERNCKGEAMQPLIVVQLRQGGGIQSTDGWPWFICGQMMRIKSAQGWSHRRVSMKWTGGSQGQ